MVSGSPVLKAASTVGRSSLSTAAKRRTLKPITSSGSPMAANHNPTPRQNDGVAAPSTLAATCLRRSPAAPGVRISAKVSVSMTVRS